MAYRILIVDDDIELLKMLKNYFEIKRYDVMMAEDGTDALEKIHKKPDIILLDINMPKIDGLEVCRRIRGKVTCPIIFLTAKVEEQDRVNGLLSGGDDYILKYHISSKQYTEEGIRLRLLGENMPSESGCIACDVTLEDAYIYVTNR